MPTPMTRETSTDGIWPGTPQPPIDHAVALRATEWAVALMAADATPQSHAACQRWRAEHPEHERAWQHLHAFRTALATLPAAAAHAALSAPARTKTGAARPGRRRAIALIATTVVAGAAWQISRGRPLQGWRADHYAGIGERREVALPDGTRVTLNTGSAIAVRYGAAERRVVMLSGEIAIATATDPAPPAGGQSRPFRVETAQGLLRALGTRFTVRQHEGRSDVSVQEGAVEIHPADAAAPTLTLHAGQRASFTRADAGPAVAADILDTAWRQGMLVVHDMPLAAFLDELSRYRRGRLSCASAVADLRVSGIFPLADTDQVLDTLPHLLPVTVRRFTPYWVSVRGQ